MGFAFFVIFFIGPLYYKLCVRTNSFVDGPSPVLMLVTLMLVLVCSFVTSIRELKQKSLNSKIGKLIVFHCLFFKVGIHAIFGGFIAGLIIPHEHDLSIKITEKIEDIINIIFLPLVSFMCA